MRITLAALLSATCLVGAADPVVAPPVPVPPATLCRSTPASTGQEPATAILSGYGSGGFAIRTSSPDAQRYFDNGMQLAHAFAHDAAVAAFRRAEAIDPSCAMCAWGEAWSRGPTINGRIDGQKQADLAALADRAVALATGGPATESALIAALQKRYHDGGGAGTGDLAFAQAMDDLARTSPDDDELAIIAADAWMIPASHQASRDHLDRAVALLATVLGRTPRNSGAIHFYIHATEMNGVGADALPYAERLQALAPAASHLVHMPSHTFFWVGRYRAAAQSNIDAVAVDEADAARQAPKDGVFDLTYHAHNVQFGLGGALMAGDAEAALALAAPLVARLPQIRPGQGWPQALLGTAYYAYGRHGSDAAVDALADPGRDLPFARSLWRYARGEAAARRGDLPALRAIARSIDVRRADFEAFGGFAPKAKALVEIARLVLVGRAAMLEDRWADAARAYRRAAELQEEELADLSDPPAWWYPVRRSLAAALMADGRDRDAAQEAKKTLVKWVGDPLSERILADIARHEGRVAEADRWLDDARRDWVGDPAAVPLALL